MKPGEEFKVAGHVRVIKMLSDIAVVYQGQVKKRFKHDELVEAIRYAGWLGGIKERREK